MVRLAANISTMFTEWALADRVAAAAAAGFAAVEVQFPYDVPVATWRARLDAAGVPLILLNAPAGDRSKGERGLAGLPGREAAFREAFCRALDYASALDVGMIHVLAGIAPAGLGVAGCLPTLMANLAWAAEQTPAGIRLMLEPINPTDAPHYILGTQALGAAAVSALGTERFGLQFDIYHVQMTEGDVIARLRRHAGVIGHIQIAEVPGRGEPGGGELNWGNIFAAIEAVGYQGWVGCEYLPVAGTLAGLGWLRGMPGQPETPVGGGMNPRKV